MLSLIIKLLVFFVFSLHAACFAQNRFEDLSYFPRSLYHEAGNKFDSMSLIWTSKMLGEFGEPKIFDGSKNCTYRFTWTRSFDEKIVIRFQERDTVSVLIVKTEIRQSPVVKKIKGKGSVVDMPKLRYRTDSVAFGKHSIEKMQELIRDNQIWKLTNKWEPSVIHDGAGWCLEIYEPDKGYKYLYRHSPTDKSQNEFRQVCLFLINLIPNAEKLKVY